MCAIAGILDLTSRRVPALAHHLGVMDHLLAHRGPDDKGSWLHEHGHVGFAHRRLSVIDLAGGAQPMIDDNGNVICFNGEIFNHVELRKELAHATYRTASDTEVILKAYQHWNAGCLDHLRGMFAFAIWDEHNATLLCARDRFGIKPFYYCEVAGRLIFASEAKALLPFLPQIETDLEALKDYLVFQFYLDGKTLFKGVKELPPGHSLTVKNGEVRIRRYWEVFYRPDFDHTSKYFEEQLRSALVDSVRIHTRSDVPIGSYVSGGLDSGLIAAMASLALPHERLLAFNGRYPFGELYDESAYAKLVAKKYGMELLVRDISEEDCLRSLQRVIYHLDYPVAGPGAIGQFHVSELAVKHRKVVLGGQGGDEIFGGYVRYLIAYFEQCIKGAIDGTLRNGNFIVTYESIIPNLPQLRNYKPLLREFWREGLFDDIDRRYYRLINRATDLSREIQWADLGDYDPFDSFRQTFNGSNVGRESYFDKMTHFDFKTLLPALLQVEDRMSMAHGLESRVPFLDHTVVELAATMPSDIKFESGTLKRILIKSLGDLLPAEIATRQNKMGFPVPLGEWMAHGQLREFVSDLFSSQNSRNRIYLTPIGVRDLLNAGHAFSRKGWGLLSLELWHREFHDQQAKYKSLGAEAI